MSDITLVLEAIGRGEHTASTDLLPLVYEELRLEQRDQARTELAEPRSVIDATFKQGVANLPRWEGFWFDWLIAKIHLREAEKLVQ